MRKAREAGLIEIHVQDFTRLHSKDKVIYTVDDRPFGGGEGVAVLEAGAAV